MYLHPMVGVPEGNACAAVLLQLGWIFLGATAAKLQYVY